MAKAAVAAVAVASSGFLDCTMASPLTLASRRTEHQYTIAIDQLVSLRSRKKVVICPSPCLGYLSVSVMGETNGLWADDNSMEAKPGKRVIKSRIQRAL